MSFYTRFLLALCLSLGLSSAWAADEAPDAFVKRITTETLDAVRTDRSIKAGDINKIMQLVDTKLMQHVNFRRMTALATGPGWRKATPEQQDRLQEEVQVKGDPLQLDYRLEKTPGEGAGWKIFDLNVMGIWLVENYRAQFSKEINAGGMDGLIKSLSERNKSNAKKA